MTSLLNFRYFTLLAGTLGGRFQDVTEEEVFLSVWLKLWAIIVDRVGGVLLVKQDEPLIPRRDYQLVIFANNSFLFGGILGFGENSQVD